MHSSACILSILVKQLMNELQRSQTLKQQNGEFKILTACKVVTAAYNIMGVTTP